MIYKIILGKTEILIGEEDKLKIVENIDKNFIMLKSGEVINPSFVQGIIIDHEASRQERKELQYKENAKQIDTPRSNEVIDITKFKPDFLLTKGERSI